MERGYAVLTSEICQDILSQKFWSGMLQDVGKRKQSSLTRFNTAIVLQTGVTRATKARPIYLLHPMV